MNEYGSSSTSSGSSNGMLKSAQKMSNGFNCKADWNGIHGRRPDDEDDDHGGDDGRKEGRMNYKKAGAYPKSRDSGSSLSRHKDGGSGDAMSEDVKGVFPTPAEMDFSSLSFLINNSGSGPSTGVSVTGVEFLEKIIKTEALDEILDELGENSNKIDYNHDHQQQQQSSNQQVANYYGNSGNVAADQKVGVVRKTTTTMTRSISMANQADGGAFFNFMTSSTTSSTNSASSVFLNYKKILVLGNSNPSMKTSNKNRSCQMQQDTPAPVQRYTATTRTLVQLENCDDQLMLSINSLKSIKLDDEEITPLPPLPPPAHHESLPLPANNQSSYNMQQLPQNGGFQKPMSGNGQTNLNQNYGQTSMQPAALAAGVVAGDRRDSNNSTVSSYYCSMRSDQDAGYGDRRRSSGLSTISEFQQMGHPQGNLFPSNNNNPYQTAMLMNRDNFNYNQNDASSFYDPISPGSSRRSSANTTAGTSLTPQQYNQYQNQAYWNENLNNMNNMAGQGQHNPAPVAAAAPQCGGPYFPPNYNNNTQQWNAPKMLAPRELPAYQQNPTVSVMKNQPPAPQQQQQQQQPQVPAGQAGPARLPHHHPNEEVVLDEFDENEMIENKLVLPDDMLNYLQNVTNSPAPATPQSVLSAASPRKQIQCQDISQSNQMLSPLARMQSESGASPVYNTTPAGPGSDMPTGAGAAATGPSQQVNNPSMKNDAYRRTLEYVQSCQSYLHPNSRIAQSVAACAAGGMAPGAAVNPNVPNGRMVQPQMNNANTSNNPAANQWQ